MTLPLDLCNDIIKYLKPMKIINNGEKYLDWTSFSLNSHDTAAYMLLNHINKNAIYESRTDTVLYLTPQHNIERYRNTKYRHITGLEWIGMCNLCKNQNDKIVKRLIYEFKKYPKLYERCIHPFGQNISDRAALYLIDRHKAEQSTDITLNTNDKIVDYLIGKDLYGVCSQNQHDKVALIKIEKYENDSTNNIEHSCANPNDLFVDYLLTRLNEIRNSHFSYNVFNRNHNPKAIQACMDICGISDDLKNVKAHKDGNYGYSTYWYMNMTSCPKILQNVIDNPNLILHDYFVENSSDLAFDYILAHIDDFNIDRFVKFNTNKRILKFIDENSIIPSDGMDVFSNPDIFQPDIEMINAVRSL